jgi:anaphase-promoting complex subunit 2
VDELILRVGSVNRSAAVKALATWVDMRVLSDDSDDVFRLLSVAEAPALESRPQVLKPGSFNSKLGYFVPYFNQQKKPGRYHQ